jgi:hypothetical protein
MQASPMDTVRAVVYKCSCCSTRLLYVLLHGLATVQVLEQCSGQSSSHHSSCLLGKMMGDGKVLLDLGARGARIRRCVNLA